MGLSTGDGKDVTASAQLLASPCSDSCPPKPKTTAKSTSNNRHHVYSLGFWMSDNELAAEELINQTFCRAFAKPASATAEDIDRALINGLREYMSSGLYDVELRDPASAY